MVLAQYRSNLGKFANNRNKSSTQRKKEKKKKQGQVGLLSAILLLASKCCVCWIMDWLRIEKDPGFCEINLERQDNMNKTNYGELESQSNMLIREEMKMCHYFIQREALCQSVERATR